MTDQEKWQLNRHIWFGYTIAGLFVGLFNGVWWAFFVGAACTILAYIAGWADE